jgi:hypothetical protein
MDTAMNKSTRAFTLAELIAAITNPTILSVCMLLAIIFTKSNRLATQLTISGVLLLFLVVLPLIYSYLRITLNHVWRNFRYNPTLFLKRHPKDILLLGLVCGLPCWVVLNYLEAPFYVLFTLADLLMVAFIVALINLFYRASFHLASISVLLYIAVIIWGQLFFISFLIIPVIGWSKYKLRDHNVLQMVLGITLALGVTTIILYLTGGNPVSPFVKQ